MTTKTLLETLTEIERTLLRGECGAAYVLVLAAEDCALEIERELLQLESDKVRPPLYFTLTRYRSLARRRSSADSNRRASSGDRVSNCLRFGSSSSVADLC